MLKSWVDWWPANETTVKGLWTKIRSIGGDKILKAVQMVIGVAYLWCGWEHRNRTTFNRGVKKETEIFRIIQFTAFDWVRCRVKACKSLNWES